jgi:hypothetical protein
MGLLIGFDLRAYDVLVYVIFTVFALASIVTFIGTFSVGEHSDLRLETIVLPPYNPNFVPAHFATHILTSIIGHHEGRWVFSHSEGGA